MFFSITDRTVNAFMQGAVVVLALVVVGCILALILGGMTHRFPFSRLALVLALTPLSFVQILDLRWSSNLQLFAMIVILIGITIDGISSLLKPRVRTVYRERTAEDQESGQEAESAEVIEWKKAR